MKVSTKKVTSYQCEICKSWYGTEKEALKCESRPIQHDRGVKKGDKVRVTGGDGKGELAKVVKTYIVDKDWGHYFADRYHHAVALEVEMIESWGSRGLQFDSYETVV